MKYKKIKFFDLDTLNDIHNQLKSCQWVDGSVTLQTDFNTAKKYKNNLQTTIQNTKIFNCLDINAEFLDFTMAKSTNKILISKTITGGFYKPHFDSVENGDYSVTVFLNDPNQYNGGELCLLVDNTETKIKLDPGWGVVYETGIPHRVCEVTEGERIVCVFWVKSIISDRKDLYKYRYYRDMAKKYPEKIHENCCDFSNDLNSIFANKCNLIMRKWI